MFNQFAKRFPTEAEFKAEKAQYLELSGELFDFAPKKNNPKLNEMIALYTFKIENGYQALKAHWKEMSLEGIELPENAAEEVFLVIDEEEQLWLYAGEITVKKYFFELSTSDSLTNWSDALEESENFRRISDDEYKIFAKFYEADYVGVTYSTDTGGSAVYEMANCGYAEEALRNWGFLGENEYMYLDAKDDDTNGAFIRMNLK